MSDLTSELNLSLAVDDDDTADYLTVSLRDTLSIIDALFNQATGHSHDGAHQGRQIDLTFDNITGTLEFGRLSGQLAAAQFLIETIFANTRTVQGANYVVAPGILWVFCTAAIQVTLPDPTTTNRPITVVAVTGNTTVVATGGSTVYGGSVNIATGAVQNGVVNAGDSYTYESDGTNWRAV